MSPSILLQHPKGPFPKILKVTRPLDQVGRCEQRCEAGGTVRVEKALEGLGLSYGFTSQTRARAFTPREAGGGAGAGAKGDSGYAGGVVVWTV